MTPKSTQTGSLSQELLRRVESSSSTKFLIVCQIDWVLNWLLSVAGGVTPGASGAPHNALAAVWLFTRPRAASFTRARQTDPLHAIKPSTTEQRGQVLGAALRAHLHPAGEQTVSSRAKRPSTFTAPLTSL